MDDFSIYMKANERLEFLDRKYTSLEVLYHQREALELSDELVVAIVTELGAIADEASDLSIVKNTALNLPYYSQKGERQMTTQKIVDNFVLVHNTMTYIANDCLLNVFYKHEIFPPTEDDFSAKIEGAVWGLDKMSIEYTDNEEIKTITTLHKFLKEYKDIKHSFDEGELSKSDAGHATEFILERLRVELVKKRNIMNEHFRETVDAFIQNTTNEQWEVVTYQKDALIDMNVDIQILKKSMQSIFGNLKPREVTKNTKK